METVFHKLILEIQVYIVIYGLLAGRIINVFSINVLLRNVQLIMIVQLILCAMMENVYQMIILDQHKVIVINGQNAHPHINA